MKEEPTVGFPFFRVFPSECIPKMTRDVSVHFFIHSSSPCKYTRKFQEHSEATVYIVQSNRFWTEFISP